jgi:hypothetical protein
MRRVVLAVAVAAALALPAIAAAKGPEAASISGPGMTQLVSVKGDGEPGSGAALGRLVDLGGFMQQVYGQYPDPTIAKRPLGNLGPRYTISYLLPGPNNVKSRIVQYVYPYAKPAPLTYVKPGQRFWDGRHAHGGWYRSTPALKALLVKSGVPATA